MRSLVHTALLLALAAPASAQQPIEPTEEQKIDALKRAYHINGDSMVGDHMIDLTAPRVIQTVPEMPVADPVNKNALDALADVNLTPPPRSMDDICARHHLHRVMIQGGKAWRCKRL